MADGKVRWFNHVKKFGFIDDVDGSTVFVHQYEMNPSNVYQSLEAGDVVTYDVESAQKGLRATNVLIVSR